MAPRRTSRPRRASPPALTVFSVSESSPGIPAWHRVGRAWVGDNGALQLELEVAAPAGRLEVRPVRVPLARA